MKIQIGLAIGLSVLLGPISTLQAQQPPLPQYDTHQHLGAVTCAGNTCHGATKPFKNSAVLQNEYVTWSRQDSHANAYNVLLNEQSKRIARNLGLQAAHEADLCLDCHADNVPEQRRGKRFQINEGVTCEACHGGSERWLGPHTSGKNSHQDNLKLGLYPTESPVTRARLCLSCHFGTQDKFVTHRIMGAGHPRMSFELDTFTAIQPAHYQLDADYRERKGVWSGVQTWAIGQAVAVETTLERLLDPAAQKDAGLFPELVFFDCFACHHSLNDLRWAPRSSTGLGPGRVRYNDANLLMLQSIMQRVAPELGSALRQGTLDLHQAGDGQALRAAAQRLLELARESQQRLARHAFEKDDMQAILRGLIEQGRQGEQRDYAAAEQSVMAIGSIVNTLDAAGLVAERQKTQLTTALDKLYEALANEDGYKPAQFSAALDQLEGAYR
jgi:hypothetical protein